MILYKMRGFRYAFWCNHLLYAQKVAATIHWLLRVEENVLNLFSPCTWIYAPLLLFAALPVARKLQLNINKQLWDLHPFHPIKIKLKLWNLTFVQNKLMGRNMYVCMYFLSCNNWAVSCAMILFWAGSFILGAFFASILAVWRPIPSVAPVIRNLYIE